MNPFPIIENFNVFPNRSLALLSIRQYTSKRLSSLLSNPNRERLLKPCIPNFSKEEKMVSIFLRLLPEGVAKLK